MFRSNGSAWKKSVTRTTKRLISNSATMSSVESLRELISERLTAAAEEIFSLIKVTMVEYEEELDRQRRLLETILNPVVRLHSTGLFNLQ